MDNSDTLPEAGESDETAERGVNGPPRPDLRSVEPVSDSQLESSSRPDSGASQAAPDAMPRVEISVDAGRGGRFRITIEQLDGDSEGGRPLESKSVIVNVPEARVAPPGRARFFGSGGGLTAAVGRLRSAVHARGVTLGVALFGLSLAIYLATRLIGLEAFPIFFFTDEAVQTLLAADLVRDNFVGYDQVFFPTYFRNGYQFNLSLSVYLQVIPFLFFGKSVFVTRAVSALVSFLAPLAVGLALRDVFKNAYWWAGALVLSVAPAWFLHSRTAFETAIATALYAVCLYLYLLYRYRSPRYLYPTLIAAGLVFYAYSPAQFTIAATGLLLLLSDARYHWDNRRYLLRGAGLILLLALPYVRFRLTTEGAVVEHLEVLGSYWIEDLPLSEKFGRYFSKYAYGLSPGYWFIPNSHDLDRHVMKGYGHLLRASLPFAFIGLLVALRKIREPAYRVVLIALLAAPSGAAIVDIGITRTLIFVIPVSFLIVLGVDQVLRWLERLRLPRPALAVSLFVVLALGNLWMLRDALVNAPTWFNDYGLHGMQFGARQVFGEIQEVLRRDPNRSVIVSPSWANGTDVVARFFFPDPMPIQMGSIDGFLLEERAFNDNTLFVLPVYEYRQAVESEKFTDIRVEEVIDYPTGQPGFYFVSMRYVDDIAAILARERTERARLREEIIELAGEAVTVRFPMLDMGQIADIFDGDDISVSRTLEANPYILELHFPAPRTFSGYDIVIGSARGELVTQLFPAAEEVPVELRQPFEGSIEQPTIQVRFDEPLTGQILRIEVHDETQGEIGHVHVWELRLR